MFVLAFTLILAGAIWLALRFRRDKRRKENEKLVEEVLGGGGNENDEIARAIEASWDQIAQEYYRDLRHTLGEEVARRFTKIYLEVLGVAPLEPEQYVALVRVHFRENQSDFPLPAVMALLGCDPYWPEGMTLDPETYLNRFLPNGLVRLVCQLENGRWVFKAREGEPKFVPLDDLEIPVAEEVVDLENLGIGQPILLQNGYKSVPFAFTVLGKLEAVDQETVRLPARITCVVPKWEYMSFEGIYAFLRTTPDDSGEYKTWSLSHLLDGHSQEEDPFVGVTLFQAGTHEGYLYFSPDPFERDQVAPNEPFVALQIMDGSEELMLVNLESAGQATSRPVFSGCEADDPSLPDTVMDRLRGHAGFWSDLPDPVPALHGDTVTILHEPDGDPYVDITVLGEPERGDGISLRLPVKVVARYDPGPSNYSVEAELSTSPDTYGRIHHVFPARDRFGVSELPATAIDLNGMVMGEIREGFLYFAPYDHQGYKEVPDEPFTIFWYGPDRLEMPMDLTVSR